MQPTSNLAVTQRARDVAVIVYRLTRTFPADERYGMTSQMRRASVSIGSNIAEGCGRHGNRALVAFLQIAMGSASELEFQLELSAELEFATAAQVSPALSEVRQLMKMLSRLIAALRRKLAS